MSEDTLDPSNDTSNEEQTQMRKQHLRLMDECIMDATHLAIKNGINQEDVVAALAVALFKERIKIIPLDDNLN